MEKGLDVCISAVCLDEPCIESGIISCVSRCCIDLGLGYFVNLNETIRSRRKNIF